MNVWLVTHLQYLSWFECKNKTCVLAVEKKGLLISEPLPLVEEVYLPLSAPYFCFSFLCLSPYLPWCVSWLPRSMLCKEVEIRSQIYRAWVLGQHTHTHTHVVKMWGQVEHICRITLSSWEGIQYSEQQPCLVELSPKNRDKIFLRIQTQCLSLKP